MKYIPSLISKYRTELMGISILWIMLFHSGIQAPDNHVFRALWYVFISFGGGFGVDIFFILSGFGLICSVLNKGDHYSWKSYFKKRFLRIMPAYILVASLYYGIVCDNIGKFFYNLLFLNFILDGDRDFWYIFAIVVFYTLFPVIVNMTRKISPLPMLVLLIVASQFICVLLNRYFPIEYGRIEIMLQRFPCFCIGISIGYLMWRYTKIFTPFVILSTIIGLSLIVFHVQFTGSTRWIFTLMSLPVICILTMILNIFQQHIKSRVLVWCGKRSLELYLIHVSFGIMLMNIIQDRILSIIVYFVSSILLTVIVHKLLNNFSGCFGLERKTL